MIFLTLTKLSTNQNITIMKKIRFLFFILVSFLLFGTAQTVSAQKRKPNKRTTTQRKPTVRWTNPTTEKPIKEITGYVLNAIDFCVDSKYIYYVEKKPNNAVMKIDCITGEISTVIPGIANVYEGRREEIKRISIAGGRLIFEYGDYPGKVGIWVNGQFRGEESWEKVFATSGNYALITNHGSGTELYDVLNMKSIPLENIPGSGSSETRMTVAPNGSIWYPYRPEGQKKFGVVCLNTTGTTFYDLSTQLYVAAENIASTAWYGNPINCFRSIGQYLYVSCNRRIYRLNMLQPNGWEEYAKIPSTLDSSFMKFWPNWKGDILNNDNGSRKAYYFYRTGAFDSPQSLGDWNYIKTGLLKTGWTGLWPSLSRVLVDANNNYIMLNGSCIAIYNPDGVIGYKKAYGKIYKPE